MTPTQSDDPIDRDSFTTLLDQLVSRARAAGVGLEGTYNVRTPLRNHPDYTIEVTQIEKNRPGESGSAADTDTTAQSGDR